MDEDSAQWWAMLRALLNNVFVEAEEIITRFARDHRKAALQTYKTLYERVVYAEDPQVRVCTLLSSSYNQSWLNVVPGPW